MQTAKPPLTTGKLADTLSASTVTNPSTVFIYSSGCHTHHFAHFANLVGIGIVNTCGASSVVQPTVPIYI